jgi:hypothetical protein
LEVASLRSAATHYGVMATQESRGTGAQRRIDLGTSRSIPGWSAQHIDKSP